jgi:hypothetical protein
MIRYVGCIPFILLLFFGCSRQQPVNDSVPVVTEETSEHEPEYLKSIPDRYRPLYQISLGGKAESIVRQNLPFDSISMSQTEGFGDTPDFRVTFHRTGDAELLAVSNLPVLGKLKGEINVWRYGRLCYLIEHSRFHELKPDYRANWSCDSTCKVAVTQGDKRTEVSDYGGAGPIELWAIEELIDATRKEIDWKPVP